MQYDEIRAVRELLGVKPRRPHRSSAIAAAVVGLGALITAAFAIDAAPGKDLWGGRRTFAAELSAGYMPIVTRSAGRGSARIVLNIETRRIDWEVTYSGLTSPAIAIGLHGPAQPGTNGAQIIDLAVGTKRSPVRGSAVVPPGQIQYMLLGWTYVQVSTQRYPRGELRGKLDVVPPAKVAASAPRLTRNSDRQN